MRKWYWIILIGLVPGVARLQDIPTLPVFSADQLKEDLKFYHTALTQRHPNLYLYTPEGTLNHIVDSLIAFIDHPMSEEEFYRHITILSHYIKDGHSLILPSEHFIHLYNAHQVFCPFYIEHKDSTWIIRDKSMPRANLPSGAELLSINGLSMSMIWQTLLERQVRDGYNNAYAEWVLNNYFREYYSYIFGHPTHFDVSYNDQGRLTQVSIPAESKRLLNAARLSAPPEEISGINFVIGKNDSKARLTIKTFHRSLLKKEYDQRFKKTIRRGFKDMAAAGITHLTIDLRDNQGGDIIYGVYLLARVLDQPFTIVQNYYRIRDGKLIKTSGPCQGVQRPVKRPFTGTINVLINGGSFSNSIIVSSVLKNFQRATFQGSESGGNPHVLAGQAKSLTLPHTKIRVDIPTKRFVLTSLDRNDGRGIRPDTTIGPHRQEEVVQVKGGNR